MDKREAVNKVKVFKHLLKDYFHFENTNLFGSYTKGNNREDSDIDAAFFFLNLIEVNCL